MFEESTTLELKREVTPDINKTVVAFANTGGGVMYIGIEDTGRIVGVPDVDGTMLKITNTIRDSIKPDVTLFVDCRAEKMDGVAVIKIAVDKGTASPYYLAGKGIRPEGVYVRQGASTVPATETAILRMIRETDGEKYEDARSFNQNLTFEAMERAFAGRDLPIGSNQKKTLGLVNADGLYTNLGMLLSDQCVHTLKLAVFDGDEKARFKDRREFSGSLLKQLEDVFEFIDRYNRNRSDIEGLYRVDKRDYPVEAVREALLNAFVHRDYAFPDSALVSIFGGRIEFVSIGGLVRGITFDDVMLGISVARNRKLADVFYRLTLIEAYGTGIPKIFRSYSDYNVKPTIEVSDNAFKIVLPNVNEVVAMPDANERAVMALFNRQETIGRRDVENALSISQTMAGRIIKELQNKKKLRAIGAGKNTRYAAR